MKIGLLTSCRAVGSGLELQRWQFFRQLADAGLNKIGYDKDVEKRGFGRLRPRKTSAPSLGLLAAACWRDPSSDTKDERVVFNAGFGC